MKRNITEEITRVSFAIYQCQHRKKISVYGHRDWGEEHRLVAEQRELFKEWLEGRPRPISHFERYELLRTLNVQQFADLFNESLKGEKSFDALVDELVAAKFWSTT